MVRSRAAGGRGRRVTRRPPCTAAILRAVPPEMLGSLACKRMVRSAWEVVKTVRIGVQRVREANAQQLLKQFGEILFKEGEFVDDFSL